MVDDRQLEVAVLVGVTVTREMFGDSHNPLALLAAGVETGELSHTLRVGAERAGADDGVLWVGVDVGHGSEVDMDAHLAALAANLGTEAVDDAVGIGRNLAETRCTRERIHILETHTEAPFAVDGHEERHSGVALEAASHRNLTVGGTGEETDAADTVAVHHFGEG